MQTVAIFTGYSPAGTKKKKLARAIGRRMGITSFSVLKAIFATISGRSAKKPIFSHRISHKPVRLTAGPLSLESPQPSADGKKIYVVGSQMRAELVRYDAKSSQFLPYLGGMSVMNLDFSRDGKWISYVKLPDGELWRSRIDGSEKLQLTARPRCLSRQPNGRPTGISLFLRARNRAAANTFTWCRLGQEQCGKSALQISITMLPVGLPTTIRFWSQKSPRRRDPRFTSSI